MNLFQLIKTWWTNKDKISIVTTEVALVRGAVKSAPATGYFSSEFLTVIVGAGFVLWNNFSGHPLPDLTQEIVAAIVGVYAALRTGLKAVHQLVAAWHSSKLAIVGAISAPVTAPAAPPATPTPLP